MLIRWMSMGPDPRRICLGGGRSVWSGRRQQVSSNPWNVPTANPKGVTHCCALVAVVVATTVDVDPWMVTVRRTHGQKSFDRNWGAVPVSKR